MTIERFPTAPAILSTDPPTPPQPMEVYIRRASRLPKTLPSPSKDLNAFLSEYLCDSSGNAVASGLQHRITSLPTISSTSPYRLHPIYYSCMSATIRLSKILVHTPSLAPLPHPCGPGHTWFLPFPGDGHRLYSGCYVQVTPYRLG